MSSAMHPKHPAALVSCSTKRHRTEEAAADTLADASPWASLPEDLVRLMGWRVLAGDLLDYVRFRAACPHWRSGTECPRGRGIADPRFHPRRWMMLPEGHGLYPGHGKLRGYVRFVNLSSGAFVRVRLPLFRDHCVFDSVDGILLLQRDADTAIRLLHPFTGDIAELPPLATLVPYVSRSLPGAYQDTAKLTYLRDDLTVMMWLRNLLRIAFATSGDQQWRVPGWMFKSSCNPLSFQGKIYLMNRTSIEAEAHVFQVEAPQQEMDCSDLSSSWLPPPKLIATFPINGFCYLVECDSEILVAVNIHRRPSQFSVYRLADLIMERLVPVTSIGGNALFLHGRKTMSVYSKALPTIVEDTIVFFVDKRLLQYHLNTATWSQAADVSPVTYSVPSPCTIIHHIITCSFRSQWNKGQITGQGERKSSWRVKGKYRLGVSIIAAIPFSLL